MKSVKQIDGFWDFQGHKVTVKIKPIILIVHDHPCSMKQTAILLIQNHTQMLITPKTPVCLKY